MRVLRAHAHTTPTDLRGHRLRRPLTLIPGLFAEIEGFLFGGRAWCHLSPEEKPRCEIFRDSATEGVPPVELCPQRVNDPLSRPTDAGANLQCVGFIADNIAAGFWDVSVPAICLSHCYRVSIAGVIIVFPRMSAVMIEFFFGAYPRHVINFVLLFGVILNRILAIILREI